MKVLLPLFLIAALIIDPRDIGKINSAKESAKKAFINGDYATALDKYKYLIDSMGVNEDEVTMNMAHSYFNLNDTTHAMATYQKLINSQDKMLRSNAFQQLGVLNNRQERLEDALANFKQALKADPTNEDARYDYEMVKKKLEEKKKQEEQNQKDQNKDQKDNKDQNDKQNQDKQQKEKQNQEQKNKDQQQKDQQQKDQEKKDSKEQQQKEQQQQDDKQERQDKQSNFNPDKLKEMKVTEEKARMILEAMKNQEKQYIQQYKRKPTKTKDKSKPDW